MSTYEEFMVMLTIGLLIVAILNLKNNPVLGEQMGIKARNYILEKFNAEKILADFEDLEEDDLKACLAFAAKMAEIKSISPLVA